MNVSTRLPIVLFLTLAVVSAVTAQDETHGIVRRDHYSNLPYEIVSWTIEGKPVMDVTRFTAGPDWWQHIGISVKNVTQKTITNANFELFIDAAGKMTTGVVMKLTPDNAPQIGKLNWVPGQTMVFRVQDNEAGVWVKHFKKYDVAAIEHIAFQATDFFFNDGTEWMLGDERQGRAGQSSDPSKKLIRLRKNLSDDAPVHIKAIETNGQARTLGEAYTGGGDWLNDLKVTFSNDSALPITCARFFVTVFESHPTAPPMSFSVSFGMERSTAQTCNSTSALAPGQLQEAAFMPGEYDYMKTALARLEDLSSRTTAELSPAEVYFADGRKWAYGMYQRRDPNDPSHWIIEPKNTPRPQGYSPPVYP